MDLLTHNPLAEMFGPDFLLLYGGILFVTLVAVALLVRRDATYGQPPPPVPLQPDPYEIAYLRGGVNEVLRLAVFSLIQRGYLEVETGTVKKIRQNALSPDPNVLPPIERTVFNHFIAESTAKELFRSELPALVKSYCGDYELKLLTENLLSPAGTRDRAKRIGISAACLILGLGGYKFYAALENGHYNVGFLTLMGLVSLFILAFICQTSRLSCRGRLYLDSLRRAFDRLRLQKAQITAPDTFDPSALLLVGVFGMAALMGTPYQAQATVFQQSMAAGSYVGSCSSGGGCGAASCGGSSCGGGGCGGGGCGGGGCGGCGGG